MTEAIKSGQTEGNLTTGEPVIYLVAVTNDVWLENIIASGTPTVNYFTGGWKTGEKRNIAQVHFCKNGRVIAKGEFRESSVKSIRYVYDEYDRSINGLKPTDEYADFVELVGDKSIEGSEIGNIIIDNFEYNPDSFKVEYIVKTNERGVYIPASNILK